MLIRRARKDTVPVIILAGFLGSGKTTIINHILKTSLGVRLAVIVNDFGAVNIDALLIASQAEQKIELTNGCICCQMEDGEISEALDSTLAMDPDIVLIEASGLAEPYDVARLVTLNPNQKVGYGGLIYVVDALNYFETLEKHRRIIDHIAIADLVVVTKTEHLPENKVVEVTREISKQVKVPVIPIAHGELAPELLFDIPMCEDVQPLLLQQGREAHRHMHDEYQSTVFEVNDPISYEKFKDFINELPRGIYRMKGIMYFGMAGYEQKYILQAVGKKWDMYAEEWGDGETPRTSLVLIGSSFDQEQTLDMLQNCVGDSGSMIDVRRYLEQ